MLSVEQTQGGYVGLHAPSILKKKKPSVVATVGVQCYCTIKCVFAVTL